MSLVDDGFLDLLCKLQKIILTRESKQSKSIFLANVYTATFCAKVA